MRDSTASLKSLHDNLCTYIVIYKLATNGGLNVMWFIQQIAVYNCCYWLVVTILIDGYLKSQPNILNILSSHLAIRLAIWSTSKINENKEATAWSKTNVQKPAILW